MKVWLALTAIADDNGLVKIVLPDNARGGLVSAVIDSRQPPGVIRPSQANGLDHPVLLDWDRALDDELHLRRCPVCGCNDLYARKRMPQLTGFLAVVFAALVAMVLFGFGLLWWALAMFVLVLILDVGIWLGGRRMLVCYRCRTQYHGEVVASSQPRWDGATAERYARDRVNPIQRPGANQGGPANPPSSPSKPPSGNGNPKREPVS